MDQRDGSAWQQGSHEGSVVAEDAPAVVADAVGLDEAGVLTEAGAVVLIGGEAWKAEEGEGGVAGALGRQEVAMVGAAVLIYQFHPALGEAFERGQFRSG